MKSQLKIGALLSYVVLALQNLVGLVYTPFMLRMLGKSEYGLYSIAASIVAYLTILDLGFGNAIVRQHSEKHIHVMEGRAARPYAAANPQRLPKPFGEQIVNLSPGDLLDAWLHNVAHETRSGGVHHRLPERQGLEAGQIVRHRDVRIEHFLRLQLGEEAADRRRSERRIVHPCVTRTRPLLRDPPVAIPHDRDVTG